MFFSEWCLPGGQIVATPCRSIFHTFKGSHRSYKPTTHFSDFIWLNLLNGNLNTAKKLLDSADLASNVKSSFYLIYYSLTNDYENASKLISKYENNSIWWNGGNFFYAKLLLKMNMIEESKKIFNNIADGRFFGWTSGLFRKKAQIILKTL